MIAYIDDATSEVFARFYDAEEPFSALDSFMRYLTKNGLPCSVYSDRHSVYKACERGLTISEELEALHQPLSNFQRALKELGVELIYAYSPQAKGRIERLFLTLQDRLVKEMRLRGITNKINANQFLPGTCGNIIKNMLSLPKIQWIYIDRSLSKLTCAKSCASKKNASCGTTLLSYSRESSIKSWIEFGAKLFWSRSGSIHHSTFATTKKSFDLKKFCLQEGKSSKVQERIIISTELTSRPKIIRGTNLL